MESIDKSAKTAQYAILESVDKNAKMAYSKGVHKFF
jgi:hypothetical protein